MQKNLRLWRKFQSMKTNPQIKLRHLDLLSKENVDLKTIFKDVLVYNRWKFWKIFAFIKQIKELSQTINEHRNTDFKTIGESDNCSIKRPDSIDDIPLIAMLELCGLFDKNVDDTEMGELIIHTISIACFSSNRQGKFDLNSKEFKDFRRDVGDCELIPAMGLYKWISNAVDESASEWQRAFFEVEVIDKDFVQAGGNMLDKFNVLTTIQNTAKDFNYSFEDAQQVPYGLTQANSLKAATTGRIQTNMNEIAEARMRSQRNN